MTHFLVVNRQQPQGGAGLSQSPAQPCRAVTAEAHYRGGGAYEPT